MKIICIPHNTPSTTLQMIPFTPPDNCYDEPIEVAWYMVLYFCDNIVYTMGWLIVVRRYIIRDFNTI